jgi:Phospholipase D Active site motif
MCCGVQDSDVACAVIQRGGGKGNRVAEATVASAFFSHHQKSVVCDAPVSGRQGDRSLVAFVGGLDLTLGAQIRFRSVACARC